MQRFGAAERPTAICKLAPSSVDTRQPPSGARTAKVGAGNASSHFERDEANKTNCFNRRSRPRHHSASPLSSLPPTEMAVLLQGQSGRRLRGESGCRMRHLPLGSKSLAPVCQQVQMGGRESTAKRLSLSRHATPRDIHARSRPWRGEPESGHRQSSSCKKSKEC